MKVILQINFHSTLANHRHTTFRMFAIIMINNNYKQISWIYQIQIIKVRLQTYFHNTFIIHRRAKHFGYLLKTIYQPFSIDPNVLFSNMTMATLLLKIIYLPKLSLWLRHVQMKMMKKKKKKKMMMMKRTRASSSSSFSSCNNRHALKQSFNGHWWHNAVW